MDSGPFTSFTFEVEYLPGAKNTIADCLSRLPVGEPDPKDEIDENELVAYVNDPKFLAINRDEWQSAYDADAVLTKISQFITQGWPDKRLLDEEARPFYEVRNELSLINNLVCRGSLIVPPSKLRDRILELGHMGHLGISLTKRRVKQVYWWPGLDTNIEKLVRSCFECCNSDKVLKVQVQPMLPISPPSSTWSTLGIDILDPYHLSGENAKYIIVVVDYFSKWPEYKIVKKIDSGVILQFLSSIFRREGLPSTIISDNGPQFRSAEVESFARRMGINWKYSANYHPETNGLVERMNRVISESVQLSFSNNLNWEDALQETIWSYRTTPHSITKVSPFKVMRGREPGLEFHPCWLGISQPEICENVQSRIIEAQGKYKVRGDEKKSAKRVVVNVGDLVKVKKPEGSYKKGESKYSEPFKVVKIMSNSLQLENGKVWNLSRVAKVNPKKCDNWKSGLQPQANLQLLDLQASEVPTPHTENLLDNGVSLRSIPNEIGGEAVPTERRSERVRRPPKSLEGLKKKKQAKPNSEGTQANSRGTSTCKPPSAKEVNEILKPIPSQENSKIEVEKENGTEEEKKKKKTQSKQIRRTELKRYYSTEENPKKINEKKEKKMVTQKPPGTTEYIAGRTDTLNSIALKFNVTPNKLVEMNRLFTHTIVPGQVLFVPDTEPYPGAATSVPSSGAIVSASSSDAEYDKLPDADLARKAKPIERVLSSTSEEEEPVVVKFLKMNCRYITDGKGVVGGVMIVTPNNVMFDPHKSDPLVIENGVEEYGLICPMDEVVSIALYSDISHMKIKDALPSDIPKDLCPLYRPGEWEDLSSEKDINPFSKFKSLNKEKRLQNESSIEEHLKSSTESQPEAKSSAGLTIPDAKTDLKTLEPLQTACTAIAPSDICVESKIGELTERITTSKPRTKERSPLEEDYIDLEKTPPSNEDAVGERKDTCALEHEDAGESKTELPNSVSNEPAVSSVLQVEPDIVAPATLMLDLCKQSDLVSGEHISEATESKSDTDLPIEKEVSNAACTNFAVLASERLPLSHDLSETNTSVDKDILAVDRNQRLTGQLENPVVGPSSDLNLSPGEKVETVLKDGSSADNPKHSAESSVSYSPVDSLPEVQQDSESEIKLWLLKRMQGPIEDMMPSKEEKSKTPPMFLCIKVGKPMRKSFSAPNTVMVQQYARKRKQPEYWFAVPRERVDHLYTFFVQWSPEVYGKDAKEQGFVVVEKDELNMIDNFFSEPTTKSWEIITVEEAKRRKSICSLGEEEIEEFLPDLKHHSALFEDSHIEKLAHHLPARVQGYTWRLVYSTLEHGTSLKTLYRKTSSIDSPVLLVIKDMDNKVFGAYATHPFKFSDHYYGTGETFLYTFSPDLKVFKWTGENSYFINGDLTSIELGGGGGGFGLWLDADLYHGRSNPCHTFNNETLSKKEDFIVQDVEVWTFE